MSVTALLSLGSNLGDRKALVDAAVTRLAALPGVRLTARSAYYRTEPDGPVAQPWFLNIAAVVTTPLPKDELAAACRVIETALGRDRQREISWGPRVMDIDVVAYGETADIDRRPFVLVPAAEIAADFRIGTATLITLAAGAGTVGVEKLDWPVAAI
jgi:2-amino-4-hydroxy-6-hydroxymethyldihydropteridine diphosphokinase